MKRRFLEALIGAAGLVAVCGISPAWCQDYPTRTVRIVSPYAPGGLTDIIARVIGNALGDFWKQAVVVENRTGGGGVVGTNSVAKSAPDGYSLLIASVAELTVAPHVYSNAPYNVQRDFAPVLIVTDSPMIFAAGANAPFNNVREMIAYARSQPGGLSFASPGNGTLNHLTGERFALETGIRMVHIPYKGGGPASAAIVSGEVSMGIVAAAVLVPQIKSGRMKAIAVTAERRISIGPEWPTVAESGVPGFIASTWAAMVAPAGTPPAVISKVNADANRALKLPEVRDRLAAVGAYPVGSTPEELAARIREDSARYAKIIERINLKLD